MKNLYEMDLVGIVFELESRYDNDCEEPKITNRELSDDFVECDLEILIEYEYEIEVDYKSRKYLKFLESVQAKFAEYFRIKRTTFKYSNTNSPFGSKAEQHNLLSEEEYNFIKDKNKDKKDLDFGDEAQIRRYEFFEDIEKSDIETQKIIDLEKGL